MKPDTSRTPPRRRAGGFTAWLNKRLIPLIGPPPLGPYDTPATPPPAPPCPLCAQPMAAHEIDRSGVRTQLHCPEPAAPPSV